MLFCCNFITLIQLTGYTVLIIGNNNINIILNNLNTNGKFSRYWSDDVHRCGRHFSCAVFITKCRLNHDDIFMKIFHIGSNNAYNNNLT